MEKLTLFWEEHKNKIVVISGAILLVLILIGPKIKASNTLFGQSTQTQPEELVANESSAMTSSSGVSEQQQSTPDQSQSTTKNQTITVDVKGAVVHPGVVTMQADQRVDAVLKKVGGAKKEADLNQVNLAHRLVDQMLIYIPAKGEEVQVNSPVLVSNEQPGEGETQETQAETEATADSTTGPKVNLNSATKEQLTQLNGIGDKKADQIIAYRQEHGNFKSPEDLKNVSGIGDKIFAALADQIIVQ